jgi:hypothetical protein
MTYSKPRIERTALLGRLIIPCSQVTDPDSCDID